MNIQENISLKSYNTFGIDVNASRFVIITSVEDFIALIPEMKKQNFLILGGGSNVLFKHDFDGLIILNQIKGKELSKTEGSDYFVSVYSGEVWHEFVLWTLENGYFGLENMSLIPGTVGASPIQNIGAYGVELKDHCESVDAIDLSSGEIRHFNLTECQFGYRESVFKRALAGQYFIFRVNFKLSSDSPLRMNYGTISQEIANRNITKPNHRDISDAVIAIRSSKLPDYKELGNAGSFFKNPVVDPKLAQDLKTTYTNMPSFNDVNGTKIPAGWLIEQSGFKGYREGNVGSHKDQALVIVNHGGATGQEIFDYSTKVIQTISDKFGITLEREVNMIG